MPIFSRTTSGRESDGEGEGDGESGRRPGRRGPRLAVGLAVLVAILALGSWLGYEAFQAKSHLEETRANAQKAKQDLLDGNSEGAVKWASEARTNAEAAQAATHSLPWNLLAAVPWLGSPFETSQQISEVVLSLTADVLQPSAQVGEAISPDRLLAKNGQIDVQLLRNAAPQLGEISTAATRLDVQAKSISAPSYLSSIGDARSALQTQVADLSHLLGNAALAARLVPGMLGADGPRSYFVGFQTNAEARGTGGLLGGFGIMRADNGAMSVDKLAQNRDLDRPFEPIDLGAEFTARYGFASPMTDVRRSNLSSHFPYTAQIWQSMWEQQSGERVDGVMAIDPVALSYILGATGPVTMPDGETITKDNVVELTESTMYIRYENDNDGRKAYLQDIASEIVKKMTGRISSPRQLLDALGKGVSQGRIAVWSSVPAEQQLLDQTPLGHVVPEDPAPYAAVVINDIAGNKLDYYLARQIEYTAGSCDSATRTSTVTVRVTNNVPDIPLPDYVATSTSLQGTIFAMPKGTNYMSVTLLATTGAKLTSAFVNGEPRRVFEGTERNHPNFEVQLRIPPGQTAEVKFELTEPTVAGAPRVPVQPLIDTIVPVVSVPQCTG